MRAKRGGPLLLLAFAWLLLAPPARADALVTLCDSDDQAGAGVNLSAAIALGGTITFACPGHPALKITHTHIITRPTTIDGGNTLSLHLAAAGDLAMLFDSGIGIGVRNIGLTGNGTGTALDTLGAALLVDRVHISGFRIGVNASIGRLTVSNSSFDALDFAVVAHTSVPTNVTGATFINIRSSPLRIFGSATIEQVSVASSGQSTMQAEGGQPCTSFVIGSAFTNNTAPAGQGGGALVVGCDVAVRDTLFENNVAPGDGGAVLISDAVASVSFRSTKFIGNNSALSGGAIAMFHASPTAAAELRLQYVTFRQNRASNAGGAVYYLGTPAARLLGGALLFNGNTARGGGAVWWPVGPLDIDRGIFTANHADVLGGAVVHHGLYGPSVLSNCLMSGNTAAGGGAVQGRGLRLVNCTVAGNSAPALLGASGPGPAEGGAADLRIGLLNSIVTGSSGANCGALDGVSFADEGHNLQFPDAGCGASIPVADAKLDTMFVPAYFSPAFQAGDALVCAAAPVHGRDVYGQPRPQGAVHAQALCTIGAVEGELQQVLYRRRFYPEPRVPKWWNWQTMFGHFCCG